jgi:nitrite reductase/ring-hydroxylating ferredoxin subunit
MVREHVVAKIGDLPVGHHLVVDVAGREIGVFNVRGSFYALPNACFHQNGPLCRGTVTGTVVCNEDTDWKTTWVHEGEVVVCPWHSLEFHIPTGRCLAYPERRLPTYEVKVDGDEIKVVL